MRSRLAKLGATVAALAALAVGGSAIASAASHESPAPPAASQPQQQSGADNGGVRQGAESESAAPESDGDAAAQALACQKAGVDPNADNVQYDDATGVCSLDTGANSNR